MAADVTGVILAGGMARRLGGVDKGLVTLSGHPLIQRVVWRLAPQVAEVMISANRNHDIYRQYASMVIADDQAGYLGPLAGLAAAMAVTQTPWIIMTPCDSPFIPTDLVSRLQAPRSDICVVHDGQRLQPVFSLVRVSLRDDLAEFLDSGERKIDRWYARHNAVAVDFSHCPEAFMNINTPDDLDQAVKIDRILLDNDPLS